MGGSTSWLWCRRWRQPDDETDFGHCRFCEIVRNREDLVYEDDELYAFRDQFSSAGTHYLVITKAHVSSVYALRDPAIVTRMQRLGEKLNGSVMGFHVPPFYSVPHLHMHVVRPPWRTPWHALKYLANSFFFVHPEQVVNELNRSA